MAGFGLIFPHISAPVVVGPLAPVVWACRSEPACRGKNWPAGSDEVGLSWAARKGEVFRAKIKPPRLWAGVYLETGALRPHKAEGMPSRAGAFTATRLLG